ncbi:MAG: glycoside hydrolase family 127 protein, partial [Isosphaeraceae bacterium]
MGRLMAGTEPSQFLHNFKVAAGAVAGRHRGPRWNDGDFFKWIEAASALLAGAPDDALDRQIDDVVAVIARAQRADGYLHTPVLIKARQGDAGAEPFRDGLDFEAYNLGHLMTAACVHHRATGKSNLLSVAIRAADYLVGFDRSHPGVLTRTAVCPSHFMGLVELFRTTREVRYLDLAQTLFDARGTAPGGTDDNQDRLPFRRQSRAVGHAVRANYLYAGASDLHAETGDPTLLGPLESIWEDVETRKIAVTGGCGALYDGASPDGSEEQKSITRVHQAYGRPYQLPQSTAHNETCAAIGYLLWNARMLQITGNARHADALETVLYNSLLAGISLDGTKFFYTNTLRQLDAMPVDLRWSRRRESFISCFCCPPNVVRTIAETSSHAYGRAGDDVWVHLYGGNSLRTRLDAGGWLGLTQETDYPWNGQVAIRVTEAPGRALTLRLRIPSWASDASLSVNGETVSARPEPGRYAEISRAWASGDLVKLDLPMPARLLRAHPLVEEARNQAAVRRGPIVYCVESSDLPEGVRVSEVALPSGIELKPRFDPSLLGGLTVLEGEARAYREPNWSGRLYREHQPSEPGTFPIRLIPYHAWGNRGPSEMTVWIPLGLG